MMYGLLTSQNYINLTTKLITGHCKINYMQYSLLCSNDNTATELNHDFRLQVFMCLLYFYTHWLSDR